MLFFNFDIKEECLLRVSLTPKWPAGIPARKARRDDELPLD